MYFVSDQTVSPILELVNLKHPAKISLSSQKEKYENLSTISFAKDNSFTSSNKYEEADKIFPPVNHSLSSFDVFFNTNFSSTFDNDNVDLINKMTTFSSEANFKNSSGSIYKEEVNFNKEDNEVERTVFHEQSPVNFETQVPDFWHERQQNFTTDFEQAFSENRLPNLVPENVNGYELIFENIPIKSEKGPCGEEELRYLDVSQPSHNSNFNVKDLIFINSMDFKNSSCLTEVGENTSVRTCSNSEDSGFNNFQAFNDAENPGYYFKQNSLPCDFLNEVVAKNNASVCRDIQSTSQKEQSFGPGDEYLSKNPIKKLDLYSSYNTHLGNHELLPNSIPDLDLNSHTKEDCKFSAHTDFSTFDWNEINKDSPNSKMSKLLHDSVKNTSVTSSINFNVITSKNTFAETLLLGDFDSKMLMQDTPLIMKLNSATDKSEQLLFSASQFPSSIDLDFFANSSQNSFAQTSNPLKSSGVGFFTNPLDTMPVKVVQSVSPRQAISSFTHINTLPQDSSKNAVVPVPQNCIEAQNNTHYLTVLSNPPKIDKFSADKYTAFKTLDSNLEGFSDFDYHNEKKEEFVLTKDKKTLENRVSQSEWFSSTHQTPAQSATPAFSTMNSFKKEDRLDDEFGEFVKSNFMNLSCSPSNTIKLDEKHLVLTQNNLEDLYELNQPNFFKKQFPNLSLNQQNTQDTAAQNPDVQNYQGFLQRQSHQNQFQYHERFDNQDYFHGINQHNFQQPQKASKSYSNKNDPFSVFSMENTAKQLSLPIANKTIFKHNKPKVKLNDIHSSRN